MRTTHINKLLSKYYPSYMGCVPCDHIPPATKLPYSVVVNLDPCTEEGRHWTCIYIDENQFGFYFDSFGGLQDRKDFPGIDHVIQAIEKNCKWWTYNPFQLQGIESTSCGHFCVVLLNLLLSGRSIVDYWSLFSDDHAYNDYVVRALTSVYGYKRSTP